ncbi:macro domain-containing protein [Flammeovirga sp. SJP92]|uniref:macro domain-containing protein n=1 Tax=Flammeovirga sp. SJP92 TaxID=1775430 RepID=UPI0007898760|nr:macro domain-containing protein [Flammeovirga sp. SJP92]KXX69792.1 phage tail protein [Flammeovirga sp. SJP92]
MKFYLVGINTALTEAWSKVFEGVENVEVKNQSIFDLSCDVIVSPANSFGYMNGGIDFAISKNLGWHIEKRLQQKLREDYFGELLVGQATIVETDHKQFPYLIAAPTMRTPMTILRSPNIYLATKALLTLLLHGKLDDGTPLRDKINSIAIPGLGTGVGQVPPLVCARQMRIAWEDVFNEKYKTKEGWAELRSNYAYFFTHDERDLHYDIP